MKEIHDIIKAADNAHRQKKKTALATVVFVEGSSYRKAGARMLITEDGELTGAISGGCLEGDALRKALAAMQAGHNRMAVYDTSDEDDALMGLGLGCNGIIHVLIEPIQPTDEFNPIDLFRLAGSKRQEAAIVTLFSMNKFEVQNGTCLVLTNNGELLGRSDKIEQLGSFARECLSCRSSLVESHHTKNSSLTAFAQFVHPSVSLLIIGGGNDVIPLIQFAETLGWSATVADGRPAYATASRFSSSCSVVTATPANLTRLVDADGYTAVVLMTHNYLYDLAALRVLLGTDVPYIGILGARSKIERMLAELPAEGIEEQSRTRIFGPVGLNLGAETPEEIALSVAAEIQAVFSKKKIATHSRMPQGHRSMLEKTDLY